MRPEIQITLSTPGEMMGVSLLVRILNVRPVVDYDISSARSYLTFQKPCASKVAAQSSTAFGPRTALERCVTRTFHARVSAADLGARALAARICEQGS